ncbi:sialate O-acetylesterase [Candidatus Poribacteria bacterium]
MIRFRPSTNLILYMIVMAFLSLPFLVDADVKLPAIIGDNMVLQSGMETPIWGTADPGEKVTVTMGDQRVLTVADDAGKWKVALTQWETGGPFEVTIAGNNEITLQNVLVGEVWICSGQSNMQWAVKNSVNPEEEIAAANYPRIRLFSVKRTVADEPQDDVEGSWSECSPETVGWFSGVGYFFGRALHREMDVPIGLIHTSWGGTPAESWTSMSMLESDPVLKPILDTWDQRMEEYPQKMEEHKEIIAKWEEESKKAEAEGIEVPRRPRPPIGPNHPHKPSCLYNAMIAPLLNYSIKGAIWYQGEANAGRAYQYRKLFPAMIYDWRQAWDQGDFPFLFVQLADFMKIDPLPVESAWAELREAQLMTLDLPNTGMAVAIDVGETDDIHPKNKQDVGKRLARWALAETYGHDIVYSGPIYRSMAVKKDKIILRFDHVGDGLEAKVGGPLKGFAVAGQNMKFVWADAEIKGNKVIVWSERVSKPIAVRYGWANNPVCNLYNSAGLPASPFRTDKWPGITAGK